MWWHEPFGGSKTTCELSGFLPADVVSSRREEKEMLNRKSALLACGAIILGVSMATSVAGNSLGSTNLLTFSGPVALPGVTLGAGTYAFEVPRFGIRGRRGSCPRQKSDADVSHGSHAAGQPAGKYAEGRMGLFRRGSQRCGDTDSRMVSRPWNARTRVHLRSALGWEPGPEFLVNVARVLT